MTIINITKGFEGFKQFTTKNEGYLLSDGTLNNLHLLTKAYDFIDLWELESSRITELKQDILKCFKATEYDNYVIEGKNLFMQQYHSEIELKSYDEMQEEYGWSHDYLWNEDVFNFLSNISPDNYYFGSSEGDGACIGWFKFEDEEEEITFSETFNATSNEHMKYNGMKFEIIRELIANEEFDQSEENPRMYMIKLENEIELHVFNDEIEE